MDTSLHPNKEVKDAEIHSEVVSTTASPSSYEAIECPPSINEKALVRKIDFRVIPILFVLYVAAFLDRVNISNALTLGLQKDLKLKNNEANVALTIFFVPYVLFEIPSNVLLKRFTPHVWISGCALVFGIVMLCQGFVQNYSGLLATRFFLGFAEAGIFPGIFYLTSFWYKREESQRRFAVLWCSVLIASMFGGLLASAIANMEGVQGYSSWRWIFILEGIATIMLGLAAFFLVSDFPENAKWLSEEEREFVMARTGADKLEARPITSRDVLLFFTDPKHLVAGLLYFSTVVPIYSFTYFAPTIVKTLGYTMVQTQLHTVPPSAAAFVLLLIVAFCSDYLRLRYPFVVFSTLLTIAGLSILMTTHHNFHAEYAGICLVAMGAFSAGPVIVCWYVMNLHGHVERSIGTAWMISFGNIGGIVATFAFLKKDAPRYHTGYSIVMAFACLGVAASALYALAVVRQNRVGGKEGKARLSL